MMAKSLVGALALALLPSALAFRNTSPFFLFSTSDLLVGKGASFAQSSELADQVIESLKDCPSDTYFVVQQNGVSSADYADRRNAPLLASSMAGGESEVRSAMSVSEVVGDIPTDVLSKRLAERCGAAIVKMGLGSTVDSNDAYAKQSPKVVEVSLPAPQANDLLNHDQFLQQLLYNLGEAAKYTVIYTTTPQLTSQSAASRPEPPTYEMENPSYDGEQMELKRDITFSPRAENPSDGNKEGGLFERYQYFSPGLFMAFAAMAPLVIILGFGLNALTNLEVSYFAFSKEMGPTAQRKQ